jgi:hypothetical protein
VTSGLCIRLLHLRLTRLGVITNSCTNSNVACCVHVAYIRRMDLISNSSGSALAAELPAGRSDVASRAPTTRSRVTNGRQLLAGIDGRSAEARRYRDIVMSFADDLGGAVGLTEAQRALVFQAASLVVQSEAMASAAIRGELVDAEQTTRVANTLSRVVSRLEKMRLQRRARASSFSVADYLELKARRAADVEEAVG